MALIKLGSLITQISGKVGGQSFATGRGGSYMKNIGSYTTQRNSLTASKLNNFSFLATQWRTMSNEERTGWTEAAADFPYQNRLGETKTYSGYVLFIKFNGNLIEAGLNLSVSAPSPTEFVPIDGWQVIEEGDEWFLQVPTSTPNTYYQFEMARPVSPGRGNKGLNFVSVMSGATPTPGINLIIDTPYLARFGYYPSGSRYHYRLNLIITDTGQKLNNVIAGSYVL